MTLLARRRDTGAEVEVLSLTGDRYVLVAPPGRPAEAVLVPREELDPDPLWVAILEGFDAWTDRTLAEADA